MSLITDVFGKTRDGQTVERFILRRAGVTVCLISWAAAIQRLEVPDRNGQPADIVLGFDTMAGYEADISYQGCVVGRFANRIEGAGFDLGGETYSLPANDGRNTLHGGPNGFSRQVWEAQADSTMETDMVRFTLKSPDGQEGFPGNLTAEVVYRLDSQGALSLDYYASTDRDTPVSLTNHSYFNLAGYASGPVLDQLLQIPSEFYTPVNAEGLPDGEIRFVAGTALDFRTAKPIGRDIGDPLLANVKGFDHNFVVPGEPGQLRPCAIASDPASGRQLEIWTTMPGLQLYSGNFMTGMTGKNGQHLGYRGGFCLETQHFPNSLMHLHFPSPVLRAGETYHHTTVFRLK